MTKYWGFLSSFSLLLLVFFVSSLAWAKPDQSKPASWLNQPPPLQTDPVSTDETTLDVFITDESIFPPVLTISPGMTIRWTNHSSQTQRLEGTGTAAGFALYLPLIFNNANSQNNNAVGNELLPVNKGMPTNWQSGDIPPGSSFSQTFDQSGTYAYALTATPTVTGTVVVQAEQFAPSIASIIAVNVKTDDRTNNGNCTLREAIIAANTNKAVDACPAGSTTDLITLEGGVYSLSLTGKNEDAAAKGDLDITSNVTLSGAGDTVIDAENLSDRIFHVGNLGKLTLTDLTLVNGSGFGGGIYNKGTLTLNRVTLSSNQATGGDQGGGLSNDGQATINNSTISGNTAVLAAGIFNRGILTLNNSTVSSNIAGAAGGGIKNEGALTLKHSTISNNTAQHGGGVANLSYGKVRYQNSIIAGNTANADATHADCDGIVSGSLGYNLVGNNTGCPTISTDKSTDPLLGPLQNNGGSTETHALLPGSPAIDAIPAEKCVFTADQRGIARPQNTKCDIGSFELEAANPILTVNTAADADDGQCDTTHCSLREAINAANARPNTLALNEIHFNIPPDGPQVIQLLSALPVITDPVKIDGGTQPGYSNTPIITLDGSQTGVAVNGFDFNTGNSTIQKLAIRNFSAAGIRVTNGISITILSNSIFSNTLGIDLGGDGVTPNDVGVAPTFDPDAGANNLQNFPVLTGAFPDGSSTRIEGRLNSTANTTFSLEFFVNPTCNPSDFGEGQSLLGTATVATDNSGDAVFTDADISFPVAVPLGQFVTATATGPDGTSEFSKCVPVSPGNDTWPAALELNSTAEITQFIDQQGQSRWYRFRVQPNSQVIVTLTELPENYDLTLYKDIRVAFDELTDPNIQDLVQLNAEFASDGFAGDAVARGARSPDALARGARSPDAFAANAFSPDALARGARSPDALARGARSPESFAPDAFAPDAYSPDALARGARSDDAIARGARSPEAFSSAQTISLIGISAFEGTASEGIIANAWNNTGDFYIRVKGRNGAFNLAAPFRLEVTLVPGGCGDVAPLSPPSFTAPAGNFRTIILTDLARMGGTLEEIAALQARLTTFAARPEVAGAVVDVGADARVAAANAQADTNFDCPYAKNLVAGAIKDIISAYRNANPNLAYVVLVGNDNVIPFFRYPDRALLGPESDYIPPVDGFTTSEASLRLDYVLGQDEYGSQVDLSVQVSTLPIPDLAVGRLVETAADATRMLDAYLATSNGVAPAPTSALVTGYDFFADAAVEIQTQLENGLGIPAGSAASLITGRDVSPLDPSAWTADQLADQLLDSRHDLIFLGGHFSASSALAADYQTRLLSTDLTSSSVNLQNALIFSIGCHSGYNIVNEHGIPGLTAEPDWAQAFARKGATFIGGTGYQYGDTDFLEYSERIYLEFSRQLRTGSGPVSIGQALVNAKQIYLAQTPQLRALHEKSLIEATIFGLPMLSINMPGARLDPPSDASIISNSDLGDFDLEDPNGPGVALNLRFADITFDPDDLNIDPSTVELQDVDNLNETVEALYLSGDSGVLSNPGEPVLPLMVRNVTAPDNDLVLRGVGFRGGAYTDIPNVRALTGAPTTEIRSVHTPYLSDIFFPTQPWSVNYLEALARGGVTTRLAVTPAQFKSTSPGSETNTLRQYSDINFRLYYSNNTESFDAEGTPALSAAPVIAQVSAPIRPEGVNFRMRVIGDPVAGIQEVWVTYTVCSSDTPCNGTWQSLNLTQNSADSTLWEGLFDLGDTPENVRYIVQAVNGVGLVSMATNLGGYYIPGMEENELLATALSLDPPAATSGRYGAEATFSATLTDEAGNELEGQAIIFGLGSQTGIGVTGSDGRASATLPLLGTPPNQYDVRATFPGNTSYAASAAPNTFKFQIQKQDTALTLEPATPKGLPGDDSLVIATLTDALGRRLFEKTVVFVVTGSGGTYTEAVITNFLGRATLGNIPLPPGSYNVAVYFGGQIPLGNDTTVTLNDPRYNPATASTGLTLTDICEQTLDAFNQPDGGLNNTNWAGAITGYSIVNQQVKVGQGGAIHWKPTIFGPDQVACIKLTKFNPGSAFHGLMLKVQKLNNYGPGAILVNYNALSGNIDVEVRKSNGDWLAVGSFTPPTPVQEGDRLGARALANGKVELYINNTLVGLADAGSFYANRGGQIGLWFRKAHNAIIDDFAGGNISNP